MALNAGISIGKNTDKILQIIQRECTNATEWWRREYEGQQRYIKMLSTRSLEVQAEKSTALEKASKAENELDWYKAELQRHKSEDGPDWKAEALKYKDEAQLWKSRYEVAIRSRDDALQQLAQTQARFSLTVVPLSPTEPVAGKKRPASVLDTPAKSDGPNMTETPSSNGTVTPPSSVSSSRHKKRYPTSILYPTPAAVAAGIGEPSPNEIQPGPATPGQATPSVDPTSQSMVPSDTPTGQGTIPTSSTTDLRSNPAAVPPSTPTDPSIESVTLRKWCYCDVREYGKMVMCSNSNCPKRWFHIPCTGLKQVPKDDWLCAYCSAPTPHLPPS